MKNILCFGEILWDTFGNEQVPGGAPMNVARHLAQQGEAVSFATRIGIDEPGIALAEFLRTSGLNHGLVQEDEELPTCEVTVNLDKSGQATYIIPKPVSWDNIQTTEVLTEAAAQASAIVFGSLACRQIITRETLQSLLDETTALKVFDVNLRPPHFELSTIQTFAAMADVIKMNEEEAVLLMGRGDLKEKILEFRSKYHFKTFCVTRGENGAIVWHDYDFFEHPGYKVDVVDTVGAGDAFLATFVAGLLVNQDMDEVLKKACAVGAFVAGNRGANPVYNLDEINTLIEARV
jgi:fructokinase